MKSMDALVAAAGVNPEDGMTVLSASQLASSYFPPLNPDLGALIVNYGNKKSGRSLREVLINQYPLSHPVQLIGEDERPAGETTLGEFEQDEKLSAIYLPPLASASSFEALQGTVAHLRAPEGCPWDQEQTHQSLRKHLLEEAYETLEVIDSDNLDGLREELGDLLLQILMHAQIAQETSRFRMADVVADIQKKLIRRHPHVFGDVQVADVDHVLSNWEHYKSEESSNGPLDGIPHALPALAQAAELQDRASRVGFAWPSIKEVIEKVKEELDELESETGDQQAVELGDFLFAVVNYARWLKVDPEAELQRACVRFRARFSDLLDSVNGQRLDSLELSELVRLWDDTKGSAT